MKKLSPFSILKKEKGYLVRLSVYGSTGNDGAYTVASDAVLNGGNTDITVNETICSTTVD